MQSLPLIAAALIALAPAAFAAPTDDSDLSPPREGVLFVPEELRPESIEAEEGGEGLRIELLRRDHGTLTPVAGLRVVESRSRAAAVTGADGSAMLAACPAGPARVTLTADLSGDRAAVVSPDGRTYHVALDVPCPARVTAVFDESTDGGQAVAVWQTVALAERRLSETVGLDFWTSRITMIWPGDADYYSWGSVHVTRGDHWDVVGHELGHAIYDQADIGAMGGGAHRIDECYSTALALSEGWASYFSAWLRIDPRDPDAKFEYLVPRRAPIRFENVPDDVCNGQTNEWRVTSHLWDLIDLNDDGETADAGFTALWRALAGTRARSAQDATARFVRAGMSPELARLVWELNFREPLPLEL